MENIIKKFKILEEVEIYLSYKYSLNELEQLKDLVIENINNLISVEDFTSTKKVGSDFVVNEFFKKPSFEEHIFKVIIFLEEEKFFIRILKFINNERKSRLYLQINDNFIESLDFIKEEINYNFNRHLEYLHQEHLRIQASNWIFEKEQELLNS